MNLIEVLRNREINNKINQVKNLQTCNLFIDRLDLQSKLHGHEGCVNCLEFSSNGNILASGSDDTHIFLWDPYRNKLIANLATHHRGNIFSVKFLPKSNDKQIVTGAADHCLFSYDLNQPEEPLFKCRCHQSRIKRLAVAPELPFTFFSSSEDGCVHQYDLRESHTCNSSESGSKILLLDLKNHQEYAEVKSIAINPRRPEQLAVGGNDVYARIYDRRMISLKSSGANHSDNLSKGCVQYYAPGHLQSSGEKSNKYMTITYVTFSPDGTELLANYGGEQIYIFDIDKAETPVYLNLPRLPPEPLPKPPKNAKVEAIKISGNEFLENENYIQAIRAYTQALKLAPDNPVLYLNRATALMRRKYLGDHYESLRDCHRALKLDPHYIKAHFRLARSLYEISQFTLSNDCLQELKRRFPSYTNDQSVHMLQQDINHGLTNRAVPNRSAIQEKLSDSELCWRNAAKDYSVRFIGHCNTKTDIKEANFFGQDGEFIVAGSDDGNFFLWERKTMSLRGVFKADKAIVNCVQSHPTLPLLATSGIDHEISIWNPRPINESEKCRVESKLIDKVISENQQHLTDDSFEFGVGSDTICRTS